MMIENVDIFLLMFRQMNERIGFDFILHLILIIEKFIELQLWYVVIGCLFVWLVGGLFVVMSVC